MSIPWAEIEKEYITTYISQREIAKKYGITVVSVNKHATAGNWVQKREEYIQGKLAEDQGIQEETGEASSVDIIPFGEGSVFLDLGPEAQKLKPKEKFQLYSLEVKKLPRYDNTNPFQVKNRVDSYFDFCGRSGIPPSPAGLARWLKIKMDTLKSWLLGTSRKSTHQDIIEESFLKIHEDLVFRFQTGGINPTSGIFLLKNWFDYKDVQDVIIAPKNPLGDLQNPEELRKRIEGTVIVEDDKGG